MKLIYRVILLLLFCPLLSAQDFDVHSLEGESWYGLYMTGKKAGYASSSVTVASDGIVSATEDAAFKLNMVGMKQDMRVYSKRVYAPNWELVSIESRVDDIGGTSIFKAVINGENLTLHSTVGGQTRVSNHPRPEESLRDFVKHVRLVSEGAKIGDSVTFSLFEPMYQREIGGRSEIIGIEERFLDGAVTNVYRVKTVLDMMGIETISFVAEGGMTLEDQIAGGIITMRLEPKEIAKDVGYANDVIISNAAMLEAPLESPRTRKELHLSMRGGLDNNHILNDRRQKIVDRNEYFEFKGLRLSPEDITSVNLPITDSAHLKWTLPTVFVQSDNPRMIEKARSIIDGESNAMLVSEALCHWVYRNVRSTFSARLTNSLEVLDNMEGDCTEHSMLFVGLARAAGIPAREVAGLIYVDGPQPGFYFHQWAKVWVGEWIDVDPTFDQPLVDATHIKLSEGDLFEQIRLLPVIGQISIDVVKPTQ